MKQFVAIVVLAAAFLASNVLANTVQVTWAANHSPSGGEFILNPNGESAFRSFCIEENEHVSIGGTYNYVVNTSAVAGGLGGGSPDPISKGTAWLYSQFRAGTLAGYSSGSSPNQTDLQNAFWWLENELALANPASNPYLLAASALTGGDYNALQADANGAYGVSVWNLYNLDGSRAQDMLAVPDGGATMILLGIGFACLGFVSNRVRK
jgi:hypothetical protein